MTPKRKSTKAPHAPITLAIDIGGSGIKALRLNPKGDPVSEKFRIPTPQPPTPKAVIHTIIEISESLLPYNRVSVGFPGVIQHGLVKTAPNLERSWPGTHLIRELERKLGKPVRAANDADVQGYGAIEGRGVELVITLGTGFGTALFVEGHLVPNLEIAHHPFQNNHTYEQLLGAAALKKIGKKKWNQRLAKAIEILDRVINFDHLYIGGGNGKKVTIALPSHATIVSNAAGLLGGIALWADPNVILPPSTKGLGKGTARKGLPRKKSSKTLQKKDQ